MRKKESLMERSAARNESEIKDMIKKAFRINGLAGRITSDMEPNGKGSLFVWDKDFIPKVIARVIPSIDRLVLRSDIIYRQIYKKEAEKFAELYRLRYLFDDGYMNILYHPNPANALFQDGVRI